MWRAIGAVAVAVTAIMAPGTARAWDTCHAPLSAKGPKVHGERAAMRAATQAWEHQVSHKHGRNFANWRYSGSSAIACGWDDAGIHYWCTATAIPCARTR